MQRSKIVTVIGQGYVGLELAMTLVNSGYRVFGVDLDSKKVERISSANSPVENVSSSELEKAIQEDKYKISSDFMHVGESGVVVICVPTPIDEMGNPDLKFLESAVGGLSGYLQENTLIVNESTSYPGTLREIVENRIKENRSDISDSLFFGVAPERVSPGNGISLREVPRVVSGVDEISKNLILDFYASFCKSVHLVSTPEIAEAAKLLENTFRQVNISFINEFNLICRQLGIDTREVIGAAATKPYGFMRFEPSAGIGGHCIPVDPQYFQHAARTENLNSSFIELAFQMNKVQAEKLCDMAIEKSGFEQPKVLILGVAYKSEISDTRESPAERVLEHLESKGYSVGWIDPLVEEWRGLTPSQISEQWDIALIVTYQKALPVDQLIDKGVKVFDFTGSYSGNPKIVQL